MRAPNCNGEFVPPLTDKEIEEHIEHLAQLPPPQYTEVRESAARVLRLPLSVLDSRVKNVRIINSGKDGSPFPKVAPWPEPVDPKELLLLIGATIRSFVVCEPETALAASLWAAMTWFMDEVNIAPLAVITAPEKRCGKTQLLSILGKISYRPLPSSNVTPAAMFRSIDKWHPTLLIDEADAFVGGNEELRGLLNSGHTRDSAFTLRCVGDNHEPKRFDVWGAKALAGIGKLADTLMDRAIVLELRRKGLDEYVDRLRHAPPIIFETLQRLLARFAVDYSSTVRAARPDIPDELNDRAQDNWEPLLAIADLAGADCGRFAREAAIKLSSRDKDVPSLGVELLTDIYEIFEAKEIDRILTQELITALCEDNEKNWATYNFRNRDRRITPKQLGQLLSEYHIASCNIRTGLVTVKKGYYRSQFEDAFQRYVASYSKPSEESSETPSETAATPATTTEIVLNASSGTGFHVAAGDTLKMLVADTGTA
jgi:putative DNA primase/helicase